MEAGFAWMVTSPRAADFVVEAERCGVSSVWIPEMWGQDAFTQAAFVAAKTSTIKIGTAIAQIGARTPATLAMSSMSMQAMSGERFLLGLGTSGPQVMEGWHGIRFRSPIVTTRETIEIVRMIARGDRLAYDGLVYQLPLPDGAGRPMRTMMVPVAVPIYIASLGPRNLRLTGELADGWIGNAFMPEKAGVFLDELAAGAAEAGRSLADLDLLIPVSVEFTDDVDEAAKRHARGYAFTIGAMGSKDQNFYNAAFERQGYGDDVRAVQELWLAGRREEAADRVPVEIGFKTNLIGTPEMVKERLRLYRDSGITHLQMKPTSENRGRIDDVAQFAELVAEVSAEVSGGDGSGAAGTSP
jgi:F420-dependent oxidoreductase-like protein